MAGVPNVLAVTLLLAFLLLWCSCCCWCPCHFFKYRRLIFLIFSPFPSCDVIDCNISTVYQSNCTDMIYIFSGLLGASFHSFATDYEFPFHYFSARIYRPSFRENKPKTLVIESAHFGLVFAKTGSVN